MMKKFWTFPVGLLLGAALMYGVVVHAEEVRNYIGAQIEGQFPVTVNGEAIENPGIVVDKISYLPTRVIAELAGFEVKFDADLGIELTEIPELQPLNQSSLDGQEVEKIQEVQDKEALQKRLRFIEDDIQSTQTTIMTNRKYFKEDGSTPDVEETIQQLEERLIELEAEKSALEAQLAATPE